MRMASRTGRPNCGWTNDGGRGEPAPGHREARLHPDANVNAERAMDFLEHLQRQLRTPIVLVWDSFQAHKGEPTSNTASTCCARSSGTRASLYVSDKTLITHESIASMHMPAGIQLLTRTPAEKFW